MAMKKFLKILIVVLVVAFIILQFVPNKMPPTAAAGKDDLINSGVLPPNVSSVLKTSCYDCHSNQTSYPWYSKVAPASWLLAKDVRDGRDDLNFSEWGSYTKRHQIKNLVKIREEVTSGGMPLRNYLIIHRHAKLSPQQKSALVAWTEEETKKILK
jgi:hypothetical protein